MTTEEMDKLFQIAIESPYEEQDFKFVENKLSNRPDLHAFLRLDALLPGTRDIISASEHDQYWLDFDEDQLAAIMTPELALELTRCGIMYEEGMGLSLFA